MPAHLTIGALALALAASTLSVVPRAAAQTVVIPPTTRPAQPIRPQPATSQPAPPASQPAPAPPAPAVAPKLDPVDAAWLEKLKDDDRAPLEELRGYAPPPFGSDLTWLPEKAGAAPQAVTWSDLRGRVVVLQAFTTGNIVGRKWVERVTYALRDFKPKDLRIIGLHTPEAAERAADYLAKQPAPANMTIAIDTKGGTCDAMGIYKTPVNILVDRNGAVRFVGLNERGLIQAVAQLTQEKFDAGKQPPVKPVESATPAGKVDWPSLAGRVQGADDLRGKSAPEFFADEWITSQPDMRNKVVVITFWSTTCTPCVDSIPHLIELADKFGDRAVLIGLSNEKQIKFEEGLRKIDRKAESFHFALAVDSRETMATMIKLLSPPHTMVISSDWIVRWQGAPAALSEKILEQVIKADAAMNEKPNRGSGPAPGPGNTRPRGGSSGGSGYGSGGGGGGGAPKAPPPSKPASRKRWGDG